MAAIRITGFSGIAPRIQSRLLAENMGQVADNCRLGSGALESWMKPKAVSTNSLASGDVQSIFRMSNGVADYWLSWARDVNCVPSLIAGDEAQRIYYTGDGEPRISDLALAIAGGGVMPAGRFVLGVVAPLVAPTVGVTGGSGATVSRAYLETFVTPWGEEGAPSPVSSVVSGAVDGTWSISALNAAPINSAGITGATHAAGVVTLETTSTAYLRAGEEVAISGVVGMTDLNATHTITQIVDATHYKIALTTAQTYTSGGTWARVAEHNTSGMTRRLYRTNAGQYQFVVELPIATTSYNDAVLDADLGEVCPSLLWEMPPADMFGLAVHPGGFLIGCSKNELCFCDPWHPHAWPSAYRVTTKFPLVGVGVFGSSIVACTAGVPEILNGSHPDSLSNERTELVEPCLSKRSIVDVGNGVMYASPNGLVFVGIGGANITTKELFDRSDWQALNPETLTCAYYNGMVIGFSAAANASERSGFVFDSASRSFSSLSILATAAFVDPESANLYLVSNGALKQFDADTINNATYDWLSKNFYLPRPANIGYGQVDADFAYLAASQAGQIAEQLALDVAWNTAVLASGVTDGELDAAMLDEYMLDGSLLRGGLFTEYAERFLRVSLYADGVLKYTEPVQNNRPFSMPSGYKSSNYEVRISGNVPVYGASFAETAKGLAQV